MSELHDIASKSSFKSHISSVSANALLVISFHAPWAAPCAQMRTVLETLATTYEPTDPPKISFISIDAEAVPDVSESYDVTAVPFLVLERNGERLESISGSDAVKVRTAIERQYKAAQAQDQKLSLPPKLEVTARRDAHPDYDPGLNAKPSTNGTNNDSSAAAKNLSGYAPTSSDPATAPAMSGVANLASTAPNPVPETSQEELNARLASLVKAAPVMLFMKGTPSAPQCGFSRQLVGILRERGVRYGFFNILADEDVRQGLKAFADWPTYPQLWVSGDLVGGLDIVSCYTLGC